MLKHIFSYFFFVDFDRADCFKLMYGFLFLCKGAFCVSYKELSCVIKRQSSVYLLEVMIFHAVPRSFCGFRRSINTATTVNFEILSTAHNNDV